jgi:hypothetical protein
MILNHLRYRIYNCGDAEDIFWVLISYSWAHRYQCLKENLLLLF